MGDPTNTIVHFSSSTSQYNLANAVSSGGTIVLQPTSTQAGIAISKSPIDLSSANSREVLFDTSIGWGAAGFGTTAALKDWYLTTSSVLPTNLTSYNPYTDPQVIALFQITNCSGTSCQFAFFEKTNTTGLTDSIANENFGGCAMGASCDFSPQITVGAANQVVQASVFLNYTGANGGTIPVGNSCGALGQISGGSSQCGVTVDVNGGSFTFLGQSSSRWATYPRLDIGTKYFLGLFTNSKNAGGVNIDYFSNLYAADIFSVSSFLPAATPQTPPQPVQASGFFAPLINFLIQAGVWIMAQIFSFFGWLAGVLGPILSTVFQVLENFVVLVLNAIGNLLGWGNIGTDLQTLISNLITFLTDPTNGLPFWILQVPAYMSRFFSWITIGATWIPVSLILAQNVLNVAVAGFNQAITILSIALQFIAASSSFLLIFSFFLYTGDDALTGMIDWAGTAEKLIFSATNIIFDVVNVSLDFMVLIISLVPKPFVQSSAGKVPRLPSLGVGGGSLAWPRLDFAEALSGNLIVYWLWMLGLYMSMWYESRNPCLFGSLCALVPATASNMQLLATILPVLQVFVFFSGGLCLFWIVNRPLMVIGLPNVLEESGLGVGPGRQSRGGLFVPGIKKNVAHFGPKFLGTQERIVKANQKRHPALLGAREGISVEEQATS